MVDVIINNPLRFLIPIFMLIIILLILFKFNNWVDERKIKEKKPKEKKAEPVKAEVKLEEKDPVKAENIEEKTKEIVVVTDTNYLFDRFVTSPTSEDNIQDNSTQNSTFISDDELNEIKNRRTDIQVGEVQLSGKELLYKKIEAMKNENLELKTKILSEFNSLSKEMKLMLLENLIQHMD